MRAAFVCVGLVLLLSCLSKSATLQYAWPWLPVWQVLLLAAPAGLAVLLAREGGRLGRLLGRSAWLALGACALALAVACALSARPGFSRGVALVGWAGLAAIPLACRWRVAARESEPELRQDTLVGLALLLPLLASLAFWLGEAAPAFEQAGVLALLLGSDFPRNAHPFGHWNHLGGYCVLVLPALIGLGLRSLERGREALGAVLGWSAAVALCGLLLLSSMSRGAVLGAGAGLVVLAGLAAWRRRARARQLLFGAAALLLAGAGLVLSNSRLREALLNPAARGLSEGDVQRVAMLEATPRLAAQAPVFGHGPGMLPFAYPSVRAQLGGGVETAYQLHSTPAQLWVETGAVGLLAALALCAVVAAAGLSRTRAVRSTASRAGRRGWEDAAASLAGYAVFSLTDFQLETPVITLALAWFGAKLLVRDEAAAPGAGSIRFRSAHRMAAAVLLLLCLWQVWTLVDAWRARRALDQAQAAQDAGQLAEARERFEVAVTLSRRDPHLHNRLGFHLIREADAAADPTLRATLRGHALDVLSRSLELDGLQEPVLAACGWLQLDADPSAAERSFRGALALLPDRAQTLAGLGFALEAQGHRTEAARALALAVAVQPALVFSTDWSKPPLAALAEDVFTRVPMVQERWLAVSRGPAAALLARQKALLLWWWSGDVQGLAAAGLESLAGLAVRAPVEALKEAVGPAETAWLVAGAEAAIRLPREQVESFRARLRAGGLALPDYRAFLRLQPKGIPEVRVRLYRVHYGLMHRVPEDPGYPELWSPAQDPVLDRLLAPSLRTPGVVRPRLPAELLAGTLPASERADRAVSP